MVLANTRGSQPIVPPRGVANCKKWLLIPRVVANTSNGCLLEQVVASTMSSCEPRVVVMTTRGRVFSKVGICIDVESWETESWVSVYEAQNTRYVGYLLNLTCLYFSISQRIRRWPVTDISGWPLVNESSNIWRTSRKIFVTGHWRILWLILKYKQVRFKR